jgi:hypothetical protein
VKQIGSVRRANAREQIRLYPRPRPLQEKKSSPEAAFRGIFRAQAVKSITTVQVTGFCLVAEAAQAKKR